MLLPPLNLELIKVLAWHCTRNATALFSSDACRLQQWKWDREVYSRETWADFTHCMRSPAAAGNVGWQDNIYLTTDKCYSLQLETTTKPRNKTWLSYYKKKSFAVAKEGVSLFCFQGRFSFLKWNDIMKITYLCKHAVLWWISLCWQELLFHRHIHTTQHKPSPPHKSLGEEQTGEKENIPVDKTSRPQAMNQLVSISSM